MKKKILLVGLIVIMFFVVTACSQKTENLESEDAIQFKEEYESLNGKTNSNGNEYRSISIEKENPFIYLTAEELIDKMDNHETFYVYFGSKFCPWCRSVIEKAIEIAQKKGINEIYYVSIWDDNQNEILRDQYILNSENELEQTIKGSNSYYELLNRFDPVLSDYTLKDENGNQVDVGEKRIYAPNFIYIDNGTTKKLVSGISSLQTSSRGELTTEILKEESEIFDNFFNEG